MEIRTDTDIRNEATEALEASVIAGEDKVDVDAHWDVDAIVSELVSQERDGGYDEQEFWATVQRHAR